MKFKDRGHGFHGLRRMNSSRSKPRGITPAIEAVEKRRMAAKTGTGTAGMRVASPHFF